MSWAEWNGKQVLRKFRGEASDALMEAAGAMKAEVLQQIPHDEGTLQSSVTVMKDPQDDLTVHIGAGGGGVSGYPVVPYAVKWHETEANFQKGRKSQYVRDPLKMTMPKELMKALKKRGLR